MSRTIRFIVVLVLGLAIAAAAAAVIVRRTTTAWFDKDLNLRASLAVNGARQGLVANWSEEGSRWLRRVLTDITEDERLQSACACSADGVSLAATDAYPETFSCSEIIRSSRRWVPTRMTPRRAPCSRACSRSPEASWSTLPRFAEPAPSSR